MQLLAARLQHLLVQSIHFAQRFDYLTLSVFSENTGRGQLLDASMDQLAKRNDPCAGNCQVRRFCTLRANAQGRRHGVECSDCGAASIDAVLFVCRKKQRAHALRGFRSSQKEMAVGQERKMESGEHVLLHLMVEVNQQIAATHQVKSREWWITQNVMRVSRISSRISFLTR